MLTLRHEVLDVLYRRALVGIGRCVGDEAQPVLLGELHCLERFILAVEAGWVQLSVEHAADGVFVVIGLREHADADPLPVVKVDVECLGLRPDERTDLLEAVPVTVPDTPESLY